MMSLEQYVRNGPEEGKFTAWIWGLNKWGRQTQVRVACIFAEACLHIWEQPDSEVFGPGFGSPSVRRALQAAKAWLADPSEENRARVGEYLEVAREVVDQAEFIAYESWNEEAREALMAADSSICACEAAVWLPEPVLEKFSHDPAEAKARVDAGPAFECIESIRSFRIATNLGEKESVDLLVDRVSVERPLSAAPRLSAPISATRRRNRSGEGIAL